MMQLTCGRCGTQWAVVGSTAPPCPRCGAMVAPSPGVAPATSRSPMAATTERTALGTPDPVASRDVAGAHTLPAPTPAQLAPYLSSTPSYPAPATFYPSQTPSYPDESRSYWAPSPVHLPSYPAAAAPPPVHVVIHAPAHAPAYAQPPPGALAPYHRKRDSGIAALLSFFVPGAGQLYNGQVGKGAAFLLVTIFVNVPLMFVWVGFVTQLATWLWAMIDAYVSAEKINRSPG